MDPDKKVQITLALVGELTSTVSPVRISLVTSMDQKENKKQQLAAYPTPKIPKLSPQLSQLNLASISVLKLYYNSACSDGIACNPDE